MGSETDIFHPDTPILQVQHQQNNKANTGSFQGGDVGSGYDLMLTTIKLKLKTKCFTKSPHVRFGLEKLKVPKIAEVFQAKVGGKFATLCIFDSNVDTIANSFKAGLRSTNEEVFGRRRVTNF